MVAAPEGARVEIRLLGPIEAVVDGRSVSLGGPQARALLSLLAVSVGTPVSLERLIAGVWGEEDQPAAAANTVQVYVSRLRRAITPEGGAAVIRSAGGGYQLDLPVEAVDLHRFERLAARGHDRLVAGDLAAAEQTLADAIALWRSPSALPDLRGDAVTALQARLDRRLVTAQAEHADAQVGLGHPEQAAAGLEALVRLHPLDEGLVVRLMTALYHSGRQADALAAYAAATERLADELGVDPGSALRDTHAAVLRQTLSAPTATAPAGPPVTPVTPAPAAAPTAGAAPGRTPAAVAARERLRSPRGQLIGRRAEIAQALDLLDDPAVRVVTLLGPGGIGKTRVALALAGEVTCRVAVVPLAAVSDESELLPAVVQALGAEPEWPGQDLVETVTEELADQRVVLILDNIEQLLERSQGPGLETTETLVELLERLPELSLVVTSRVALRLHEEHLVALGPLGLPAPEERSPEQVRASESVQLFLDRARAVAPDFAVTADNAAAVAELCRMLDGQPLALELAAARTRVLRPQDMVQRTGRLLQLLTGGGRDLPDRQRSMRAALDGSHQLLDPAEAAAFAQLSVFVGGWTMAAAEQVCALDPAGGADSADSADSADVADDVVDVITRLVDRSLVVADGSGRLSMLETVREYAAQRLAERGADDEPAARRRHTAYFAGFAADVGARFAAAPDASTRAQLDADAGNLTAALTQAAADGDETQFGQLVIGTLTYWFYTGRLSQGERWLALTSTDQLPIELRAQVLRVIGNVALVKGDPARAAEPLDGAIVAAREIGDQMLLAKVLSTRSLAYRHAGSMPRALECIDESLRVAFAVRAEHPDEPDLPRILGMLQNERGEILDHLGSTGEARTLFEAYRQQAIADNDESHLAWALINLALNHLDRGQDGLARELIDAALHAADQGGSTPIQGDAQMAAGLVELLLGDPELAVQLEADAARKLQSSGLMLTLPDAVSLLGAALLRAGQPAEAARMLAAGAGWRAERGLVVVSRIGGRTIEAAEADLAEQRARAEGAPLAAAMDEEAARGAAAPYGVIEALELPAVANAPGSAGPPIHLVDLGQPAARSASSS